jgi:hypothetical protein
MLMLFVWIGFFTRYKAELRRVIAWPALIFTSLSSWAAIWGSVHLAEMFKRSAFDFGFEQRAFWLSIFGMMASLVWVIRSRQWCSWGTLSVALWMSAVWMLACAAL